MRNYPRFPTAIPHPRAGCPRVTHPFAAVPSRGLPLNWLSLDLHVLSTPPAFVLSQDQTLRRESEVPEPEGLGVRFRLESARWESTSLGPISSDPPVVSGRFSTTVCCTLRHGEPRLPADGKALAFDTLFSSQGARRRVIPADDARRGTSGWGAPDRYGSSVRKAVNRA